MAKQLLKGTAFLTGAASGIGQGAAFALATHGIRNLTLTDVNKSTLLTTSQELKSKFPNLQIEAIQLNVCNEKEVDEAVKKTVDRFGRIDVAVNVAGIGGSGKGTHELSEEGWRSTLDVNLDGVWRCQRAQVRVMLGQENLGLRLGRGNIINIASMYGLTGTPQSILASPYVASKHGVIGLTKADASQYASQGIRINALCPGYVNTPLLKAGADSGAMDGEIAKTPMGRLAEVEEIGDCIVFLASEMSSFITGSALLADGGYLTN